jgi:hypothetical protein
MKGCDLILGTIVAAVGSVSLAAQAPVLSVIEAPYVNLQSPVSIAGQVWAAGTVAYGSAGTPLILSGWNFGSSGTVTFTAYKNGAVDPNVSPVNATVIQWATGTVVLQVPAGAYSGTIKVTNGSGTSNALPFMVTPGSYSASCPAQPPPQTTTPTVISLGPPSGNVGLAVTISGSSFGAIQGQGSVTFNGVPAGVLNWSDSSILAIVPSNATTGPVVVTLENGQTSNSNVIFSVNTVNNSSCLSNL